MDVKHVEALRDSLLVVQQVAGMFRCFEGSPNAYLINCLDIIAYFAEFWIQFIPRHEDNETDVLAQWASGFDVGGCNFHIKEKTMQENSFVLYARAIEMA